MREFKIHLFFLFLICFVTFAVADDDVDTPHGALPQTIALPDGFQPEGIVRGRGPIAYVGSLVSESIYQVNLLNGKGEMLVHGDTGGAVVGLTYDSRSNYIYTAGGPFGTVSVFNAANGDKIKQLQLTNPGTFINDGIVTDNAVYFTDSFAPVIYRIPLADNGRLMGAGDPQTIALRGDFEFVTGNFNGNGIERAHKKDHVILVNSATGKLYDVNGLTGDSIEIRVDNGSVMSGDGLLRRGNMLYVAQNFLNQFSELKLNTAGTNATITRVLTSANFRIPTTITGVGDSLYAVNARFDVASPPFFGNGPSDKSLDYDLARIALHH